MNQKVRGMKKYNAYLGFVSMLAFVAQPFTRLPPLIRIAAWATTAPLFLRSLHLSCVIFEMVSK
jgi:hypothetical protein